MIFNATHVQKAFGVLREKGIFPNKLPTKWEIIDPKTGERFPPKAVLRVAKELANDSSFSGGGGWPTNDPLRKLGFEIVLKGNLEESETAEDIEAVLDETIDATTKQRLVNARLGQGGFREALLEIWQGKCPVTGCEISTVLRASHIKPWRLSDNRERLDPENGILLAASIDALFDKYLITITKAGAIRASSELSHGALTKLGIPKGVQIALTPSAQVYLKSHRMMFKELCEGKSFKV
jgi:putative restriction endonuclease